MLELVQIRWDPSSRLDRHRVAERIGSVCHLSAPASSRLDSSRRVGPLRDKQLSTPGVAGGLSAGPRPALRRMAATSCSTVRSERNTFAAISALRSLSLRSRSTPSRRAEGSRSPRQDIAWRGIHSRALLVPAAVKRAGPAKGRPNPCGSPCAHLGLVSTRATPEVASILSAAVTGAATPPEKGPPASVGIEEDRGCNHRVVQDK